MRSTSLSSITTPAVRFGATHGYRFAGDTVELNASFTIAHRSAHQRSWALQLWACPSVPARHDDLVGYLVAEAPLPAIVEIAGEAGAFTTTAVAQPPAGDRDYSMVLVLVARRDGGDFDEVHDVASFPSRERFILPRLAGPVSYRVAGGRVRLDLAGIENPRDAANTSGTISVELWALFSPYSGGNFNGSPLAGAVLGTLAGQDRWTGLALDLPFTSPAAGADHVAVMLREWTGAGYTTRDFANLGTLPAPPPQAANYKSRTSDLNAPEPAPAKPAAVAPTPAPVVATTAAAPAAKPAVTAAALKTPAPAGAAAPGKVSLNTATLEQLLAVKGLPRAVADRLVRDRPFKSVDDIINVKGMGEKLLARVRSQLTL